LSEHASPWSAAAAISGEAGLEVEVIIRTRGAASSHSWTVGFSVRCADANRPLPPLSHAVPKDIAPNLFNSVGTVEISEYREPRTARPRDRARLCRQGIPRPPSSQKSGVRGRYGPPAACRGDSRWSAGCALPPRGGWSRSVLGRRSARNDRRPAWIVPGVVRCHPTTSLLPVLTQAKEREDEQDHDDQTDEINESIHVPLREVILPGDLRHQLTRTSKVPGRSRVGHHTSSTFVAQLKTRFSEEQLGHTAGMPAR
jgi:hypothetical protein